MNERVVGIHAKLLNEQGRPTKCILPPRNTRPIAIEQTFEGPVWFVLPNEDWARRSVFPIDILPNPSRVLLYNGGFETQYISHGDLIAKVVLFTLPGSARWG